MKVHRTIRLLGLVAVLIAGSTALPASAASSDRGEGPAPTFGTCKKTFSSGSGASRFSWCFTTEGSVNLFEGPAGVPNLGSPMDGFCLAASGIGSYASSNGSQQGLQPPTFPNGTSVQHKTSDNAFIITSSFAQSTATKTVTVTMKVQNKSGAAREMAIARLADLTPGGDAGAGVQIQTARSVIDTYPGVASVVLAAASPGAVNTMTIPYVDPPEGITADVLDGTDCDNVAGDADIGPTTADSLAAVRYSLGSVANNATVTVKFTYQLIL